MSKRNIIIGIVVVLIVIFGIYFTKAKNSGAPTSTTDTVAQTPPPPTAVEAPPAAQTPPPADQVSCVRKVDQAKMAAQITDIKNKYVILTVKGYGDIKVQLADADAPKTVANFIKLSNAGFYNCLTFHRITDIGAPGMPGRIVQGGDPEGTGLGGPGYTVPAEIKLPHTKGAIAMARTGDQVNPKRESSGSQFYIAVDALPFLDNQYTVFGRVVSGMDIVEKISAVQTQPDGMPLTPVVIERAIVSNK